MLFAVTSLLSYSQNWVGVGVDTVCGPKFLPNDIVYFGLDTILIPGFSYEGSPVNRLKNGFYASYDGGQGWDTISFFNSSFNDGANYRVKAIDTLIFMIEGTNNTPSSPIPNPILPRSGGYELNLYSNRFQSIKKILTDQDLPRYKWLGDVTPVSSNIVLLSMLDVTVLNQPNVGIPYFYIERMDINTMAMDSIPLPVRMENIYTIHFVDSLRGYMVGGSVYDEAGGYLLYTQDGGRSWTVMLQGGTGLFNDITFYNLNSGILAGNEEIYFTDNAGFDWYASSGTPSRFRAVDVAIAGNKQAYAIGWYSEYINGQEESSIQIYKSLDRGRNWCLVFEDTTDFYYHHEHKSMHISFSNESHGVAAYGYNRLIRTTNGGGLTECVTSIAEAESNATISIYPNPNSGSFTVNFPTRETCTITVTDLNGKVISTLQSEGDPLQISGLVNGVYVLRIHTEAHTYCQKVVVAQ